MELSGSLARKTLKARRKAVPQDQDQDLTLQEHTPVPVHAPSQASLAPLRPEQLAALQALGRCLRDTPEAPLPMPARYQQQINGL